ncbi:MAG: NAD-dependent epimerase/dehydratase family protein [Eubacteriales bacterium]|nr:NAD-dependent epimerase/dehydratase family protein [Eubacteriales bacterium]
MDIMESRDNIVLQQDIEQIAKEFSAKEELNNCTVLVTGSTGLIGSQVVKALACMNRLSNKNMKVIAFARNEDKVKKVFASLLDREDFSYVIGDINSPITLEEPVNYIIHGASATSSKYFVSNPVETIRTAMDGTIHVLEYAKKQTNLLGMTYLSSLEVYGVPDKEKQTIGENDYGYIDILNVRSSYSEGKKMVECLCASYASEYKIPVKIARLSQTFGPGVEYEDGRVFAEFARCAVEKKDIILHTAGNTVRSYCYTKDAVRALLYILLYGNVGEAYNVTNMDTVVSIREMAQLVADTVGQGEIAVKVDIPEDLASFGYNPEMVIRLDSQKLMELGWNATVDLEQMYRNMIAGFSMK